MMESLNPFDDPQQRSLVLRNVQQQYSLWPDFRAIPSVDDRLRPGGAQRVRRVAGTALARHSAGRSTRGVTGAR